jgi:hypothetical protein
MRGKIIIATCAVALIVLALPQSALAGKPSNTCPPAFDLGLVTLEQDLALPRTAAGLEAGAFTEAEIAEFHETNDKVGDGLCFQTVPPSGTEPSFWPYNYNVVDNHASVPSR